MIKPLWEELNKHHESISTYFSEAFSEFTFEIRKSTLLMKSMNGHLFTDIAIDAESHMEIGYCISTINSELKGEVESIYIKPEHRKSGVGSLLMTRALNWFDSNGVTEKNVVVAYGNEQAHSFYSKFGFYPRTTVLRQK